MQTAILAYGFGSGGRPGSDDQGTAVPVATIPSSGSGSRGRRGGPIRGARARTRDGALNPELASLPAAELMVYLHHHRSSRYAFAEVTLVLRERERRLHEAEARIREADSLSSEIRARDEVRAMHAIVAYGSGSVGRPGSDAQGRPVPGCQTRHRGPVRGARARTRDGVLNLELASLPAADLMVYLHRHRCSKYAFAEVILVLQERERRLHEAEARIRETDGLRSEIRARELSAAEAAEAEIRRAADTEARLREEIRVWRRRAEEAEARLLEERGRRDRPAIRSNYLGFPDGETRYECDPRMRLQPDTGARGCRGSAQIVGIDAGSLIPHAVVNGDAPCPSPVRKVASPQAPTLPPVLMYKPGVGFVDATDLTSNDDEDVQAEDRRCEEALEVASSKMKELLASSEDKDANESDDNDTNMLGNFMAAASSGSKSGDENGHTLVRPETSAGIGNALGATVERDGVGNDLPENVDMDMSRDEEYEHDHSQAANANVPVGKGLPETSPEIGNGHEDEPEDDDEYHRTVQDADEDDDNDANMLAAESDSMSSDANDDVLVNVPPLAVIPPDAPEARAEPGVGSMNLEVNDMDMSRGLEPNTKVLEIEWGIGGELDDGCKDISTAHSVPRNSAASQGRNAVPGNDPDARRVHQRPVWKLHKTGMFYRMVSKELKKKEMERASENYRCWLQAPRSSRSVNMEDPDPEAPQKLFMQGR